MAKKTDRRKVVDRRTVMQSVLFDRRRLADRRLSNILVEWIPLGDVVLHPTLIDALSNRAYKN